MTYTLHGRELKVGDKVWSIPAKYWSTLECHDLETINRNSFKYAWDECTYQSTIGAIPPPLGWVEGKPVRKGDVLYHVQYGGPCLPYYIEESELDFTGFSWSPPKRTEQRWPVWDEAGIFLYHATSLDEVKAMTAAGFQVFGPFEVQVK